MNIRVEVKDAIATVTITREAVKNAFNAELIHELTQTFLKLEAQSEVRIIVLTGGGKVFSAGADLNYMKQLGTFSFEENKKDAESLAILFRTISDSSKATLARVNGHAFGGGLGLIATCDASVAVKSAKFSFSEVKLGMIPATIGPFVYQKIGYSHAKHLFTRGKVFSTDEALRVGLIHEVSEDEKELDKKINEMISDFLNASPQAIREAKRLVDYLEAGHSDVFERTTEWIAELRSSDEAQEGIQAFLEKRSPSWKQSE